MSNRDQIAAVERPRKRNDDERGQSFLSTGKTQVSDAQPAARKVCLVFALEIACWHLLTSPALSLLAAAIG